MSVKDSFASAVCVKKCPKKDEALEFKATAKVKGAVKAMYPTKNVLNYCFPSSTKELPPKFKEGWVQAKQAFLQNPVGTYFNDLYLSSRAIYISFGMSVVYSFIFIYLMSAFAETIAWVCVAIL